MTAEVAILNKGGVALATDSAVTISAGDAAQKIFDSADKLFQLSDHPPIGLMIYNGMQFMGIPIPVAIKEFRAKCGNFKTVDEAATQFLSFLNNYVAAAPPSEIEANIVAVIAPALKEISDAVRDRALESIIESEFQKNPDEAFTHVSEEVLSIFRKRIESFGEAQLFGNGKKELSKQQKDLILSHVRRAIAGIPDRILGILILGWVLHNFHPSGVGRGSALDVGPVLSPASSR